MRSFLSTAATVVALSTHLCSAQTYTSCNPTENSTCPTDVGLDQSSYSADFTQGSSSNTSWTGADYTVVDYTSNGAEFTISKKGQAPTITTDFYFFFGYIEVKMKAANGTGIVSSIVLESADLDEIDWEFIGGNNSYVETNYFGKGNTTSYDRAIWYPVTDVQGTTHTYAVNWTSASIIWLVDGTAVRTLEYADANGGDNFPQTPMQLKLGIWAGGDSSENKYTIEWAGGKTDYSDGPFSMYVESVKIENFNPAMNYKWGDETGAYTSIELMNTTSASNTSSETDSTSVANNDTGSEGGSTSSTGSSSSASASASGFSQGSGSGTSAAAGISVHWSWAATVLGFAVGAAVLL